MIVNQKQLANVLGISSRQVRNLQHDFDFFTKQENGRGYDLGKCVQEYIEYKVKAEMPRGTSVDIEKEKAEHERIKKTMSQLKLRKMRKELHEAGDIELFLGEMLYNFKNKLLATPSKIATLIVGEKDVNQIINILTKEMNDLLDELSDFNPDEFATDDFTEGEEDDEEVYDDE